MINHFRTLLANQTAFNMAGSLLRGEFIDPNFIPAPGPNAAAKFRSLLFGNSPDREMIDYRLAEVMNVVSGTPFSDRMLTYDRRITYRAFSYRHIFDFPWGATVASDSAATIYVLGDSDRTTATDKLLDEWTVVVDAIDGNSAELTITRTRPEAVQSILTVGITNGLSDTFALPGSLLTARIDGAASANDIWRISRARRPVRTLADVVASVNTQGDMASLFDGNDEESVAFRSMWRSRSFGWQVAGITLAVQRAVEQSR